MMNSPANKIIAFNGSPVKNSNTDLLTGKVLEGAEAAGLSSRHVYLNDLKITPCQSCGESPGEKLCLIEDDLFPFLHETANSDIVVLSSPVYFDSVSAQAKLFIDRCNCLKPLEGYDSGDYKFTELNLKKRLGIIILVGGEREKFDHALPVIKGFFIWTGIKHADQILYTHADYKLGEVKNDQIKLRRAFDLGFSTAQIILQNQ